MIAPAVRLLLVDDHPLVRMGLATLLATVPRFVVVGEAATVAQTIARTAELQPDVVILDVRLPDGSGVEACREIRAAFPHIRVIMLTSHSDTDAVIASILAGAAGYLLKQSEPQRLIDAVETVARGGSLLDPGITDSVLNWMRQLGSLADPDPLAGLTEPERRMLTLIAEGKTNREIAADTSFSEHTVKSYVSNILRKLNLTRRAEAAAFMVRHQQQRPPTH